MHDAAPDQLVARIEEPVCGDEIDAGMVGPAGEQGAQQPGGGRLADSDAARDADHVRHLRGLGVLAEEGRGRLVQSLPAGDLEVDQPGQWQVDLGNLGQIDLLAKSAQPDQFLRGERERCVEPQFPPLLPV